MICGHWTTPHDYKTTSKGWDHNRPYHRLRRISHLQSHKVFPRIWRLSLSSPPSSSFASCNPPSHHQEHLFISPIANISPLWTIGVTGMGGVGSCHTVGLSKNIYKIYNIPTPPSPPFSQCFFFYFQSYLPPRCPIPHNMSHSGQSRSSLSFLKKNKITQSKIFTIIMIIDYLSNPILSWW